METIGRVRFKSKLADEFHPELINGVSIQDPFNQIWSECDYWGDSNLGDGALKFHFAQIGRFYHVEVYSDRLRFFVPAGMIFYTDRLCKGFELKFAPREYFDGTKQPERVWSSNYIEFSVHRTIKTMSDFCRYLDAYLIFIYNSFEQEKTKFRIAQEKKSKKWVSISIEDVDDTLPF